MGAIRIASAIGNIVMSVACVIALSIMAALEEREPADRPPRGRR